MQKSASFSKKMFLITCEVCDVLLVLKLKGGFMNISSNYQFGASAYRAKMNTPQLQTNPNFEGKEKIVQKGFEKVIPKVAAAGAALTAATVLAMQNGKAKVEPQTFETNYGPVVYKPGNGAKKSVLEVSRPNGMKMDIFENIPQETLSSPVASHITQIKSSTINPKVGIVITQNQSKPVIAINITFSKT